MIRVYDTMVDSGAKQISRYGLTYNLQNITKKGNVIFYHFTAPGVESLVVVPAFLKQFHEIERIVSTIPKGKSFTAYERYVRAKLDRHAVVDDYNEEEGENSKMFVIRYKDIEVELTHRNGQLELIKLFTIKEHNLFGNEVFVDMRGR